MADAIASYGGRWQAQVLTGPIPLPPLGPSCHFCHVKIPDPWLGAITNKQPITEKEKELLDIHWQDEADASSRLGCQVTNF
jgi:hypothetical protein